MNALSSEEYIRFVAERTEMRTLSVEAIELEDGAVTIVSIRAMKSDMIPANFRSFVGDELEIRQTEAWASAQPADDDEYHRVGTFALEIAGAPVRISGDVTLQGTREDALLTYSGDVVASIPLFGSMIESAVAQSIGAVLAGQRDLLTEWLSTHTN